MEEGGRRGWEHLRLLEGSPFHRSLGTALLTPTLPRLLLQELGWKCVNWSNKYSTCSGHRPEPRQVTSLQRHTLASSHQLQNQTANWEGKNLPERIIRWLLGEKIVNVLVPFTKPQPKVTYKILERKQCCRLWLPSCGRKLWPTSHSREGSSS